MTLQQHTKRQIYEYLCSWIDNFKVSDMAGHHDFKPFHSTLLPKTIMYASSFERSFSTGLGSTFEAVAYIVAQTHFQTVEKQYKVEGFIPIDSLGEVARIEENLDRKQRAKDYKAEVQRLVQLAEQDKSSKESRGVTSDLYVCDKDGNETYFEIKGPQPNKGQCLKVTRDHLLIHCIRRKHFPQVKTYYGMAYNPYGEGNRYKHSFALTYFDIKHHTLMGKAFWNYLGGTGTYEDILSVYREVGQDQVKLIRDKAFVTSEASSE